MASSGAASMSPAAVLPVKRVFLRCMKGLEMLMLEELHAFHILKKHKSVLDVINNNKTAMSGLIVQGDSDIVWRSVMQSRILKEAYVSFHSSSFHASKEPDITRKAYDYPWSYFMPFSAKMPIPEIEMSMRESENLRISKVCEKVEECIKYQLKKNIQKHGDESDTRRRRRTNIEESRAPKVLIDVCANDVDIWVASALNVSARLWDQVSSVYTHGDTHTHTHTNTHKHTHTGINTHTHKSGMCASMLAAALYKTPLITLLSQRKLTLLDPFCGYGELILEAMSMALGIPNGAPTLDYPFLHYPSHNKREFAATINTLRLMTHPYAHNLSCIGTCESHTHIKQATDLCHAFQQCLPRTASDTELLVNPPTFIVEEEERKILTPADDCVIITHVNRPSHKNAKRLQQIITSRDNWIGAYIIVAKESSFADATGLRFRTLLQSTIGAHKFELLQWHP